MTEPQRRIDDQHPERPLEWGDAGTPLPKSSMVYFARALGANSDLWVEIKTQENLNALKVSTAHEVRTLFTVPVDHVARAPITSVVAARAELDRIAQRAAVNLKTLPTYQWSDDTPYVKLSDVVALLRPGDGGGAEGSSA